MNRNKNHRRSWQNVVLSILCVILFLILAALIAGTAYVNYLMSLINHDPGTDTYPSDYIGTWETDDSDTIAPDYTGPIIDPTDISIDTAPSITNKGENIVNILLVGQDRRNYEHYRTRSDSMILCTFNKANNTITLTSFMRDMYVTIPGYKSQKMNAAYALGGMSLLKETMAVNFGVHVDVCLEVDFDGFIKVIDTLGGVDITLNEKEVPHLNNQNKNWNLQVGLNHLTGEQALAYSRIRKVGNADYERTERQRRVITALLNQAKGCGWSTLLRTMQEVLPTITSDTSASELINYAAELFPLLNGELTTQRIPANGTFTSGTINGVGDSLIIDFDANRAILRKTLGNS